MAFSELTFEFPPNVIAVIEGVRTLVIIRPDPCVRKAEAVRLSVVVREQRVRHRALFIHKLRLLATSHSESCGAWDILARVAAARLSTAPCRCAPQFMCKLET